LVPKGRPLRIATQEAAVRDLLRVGRNVNMMDLSALDAQTQEEA
jgi:hypothetical protein